MDKKKYDYWLYSLKGIGKKAFLKIYEEGYSSFFLYKCDKNRLPSFLSQSQTASILKGREISEERIGMAYEKLMESGVLMTVFGDRDYPEKLSKIPDAPAVIFYKGKLPQNGQRNIAVIGARNCSEYGKYVAKEFAAYFAKNNIGVISGMANGIDGVAQKAALKAGGFSTGVLGSGVNVCYPMENYDLYKELIQKGCIMSEYLPNERATANLFPPRNRIISGMADALLVIEAKEKSGTLITVEMALEQGRDVYVVPGRITDELSKGCNKLLLEGALMATSPKRMLEDVYQIKGCDDRRQDKTEYTELEKKILSFLEVVPMHINVLQEKTGIPLDVLYVELMHMMIDGTVLQNGSNWYQKRDAHL